MDGNGRRKRSSRLVEDRVDSRRRADVGDLRRTTLPGSCTAGVAGDLEKPIDIEEFPAPGPPVLPLRRRTPCWHPGSIRGVPPQIPLGFGATLGTQRRGERRASDERPRRTQIGEPARRRPHRSRPRRRLDMKRMLGFTLAVGVAASFAVAAQARPAGGSPDGNRNHRSANVTFTKWVTSSARRPIDAGRGLHGRSGRRRCRPRRVSPGR